MSNCFICKEKTKRKKHYLCSDCYEIAVDFYNEVLQKCNNMDEFAINVFNGKGYSNNLKLDYLAAMWHLFENHSTDDALNLLFKNKVVLQNVNLFKELLSAKDEKINELNEILKNNSSIEYKNNSKYNNKSILCEDGHVVKSNPEFRIDQFLYKNGIVHAYEKTITLKDGSQIHPDFYIPEIDVYIEYHGVKGSSWYNKMNKYKDNIFKIEQMTVIVINYKQEEQIEQILPILLNQNGLNKTFR